VNNRNFRIVVDAMGGDKAPQITVEGVCLFLQRTPMHCILVGNEPVIRKELEKYPHDKDLIDIVHTEQEITMEDSPWNAIREKPDASLLIAVRMLAAGEADGMVSAGSTGAVILSAAKYLPMIPGVKRAALGTIYPTMNEQQHPHYYSLMLDIGANVNNQADDLVHYAYMGKSYMQYVFGVKDPRIGLLNIGAEAHKGNAAMREAYKLLSSRPDLSFIGNVEGNDLVRGRADVIVSEGMSGNIAIKTMEGAGEAVKALAKMAMEKKLLWKLGLLFLSGGIKRVQNVASYEEYGGAPLFGFNKPLIKCHGRSSGYAFMHGLRVTSEVLEHDMTGRMRTAIAGFEREKTIPDRN
jgi:phosphate acyltransferase